MPIDFGRHSDDYARHRPGFPAPFFERLERILPLAGTDSLDLATGPGVVALELAARGSRVTGIDVAGGQIDAARQEARRRGLEGVASFEIANAEASGLADCSFDLVSAGQCWHWFDGPLVFAEAKRLLRPGGLLVIADYSYLAAHSPVARETEELVLQFNPSWTMAGWPGLFPERIDQCIDAGFAFEEAFCFHHDELFSHVGWRGRVRTCNGVGSGGLPAAEVENFDQALAKMLQAHHPDPLTVEHRVWCVAARKPR